MKKKKTPVPNIIKETPEVRKKRVSSGVKYRGAVFENKKKRQQDKLIDYEENL